jgi:hypothetical protein
VQLPARWIADHNKPNTPDALLRVLWPLKRELLHAYRSLRSYCLSDGRIATVARLSVELQGDDLMTAVRFWLESRQTWLLHLDNADDLRHFGLDRGEKTAEKAQNRFLFVPCGSHGSILWTTRDERAVGHLVGVVEVST